MIVAKPTRCSLLSERFCSQEHHPLAFACRDDCEGTTPANAAGRCGSSSGHQADNAGGDGCRGLPPPVACPANVCTGADGHLKIIFYK